jgi:hypothetical protein
MGPGVHDRARVRRAHVPGPQRSALLEVFVTEDMVGHKLGEFSNSRTFRGHTNKKEGIKR